MKSIFISLLTALVAAAATPMNVTISTKGSSLAFDNTSLKAKSNEQIRLTFKNNADKDSGLNHSWVLTKPGKESEVADAARKAGQEKDFMPDSPDIIAHTGLIKPGASQTIEFKAPAEPGTYPFICTSPAHASTMHGTLEVAK